MMKRLLLPLIIASALTLSACSSDKTVDPYAGNDAKYIYASGHTSLRDGDWNGAITAFQSLDAQYPFGNYARMGDLELIYAQYQNDDPALALAAANRFIRLYPSDPNIAYAYYMRGVINFENGRSFLERYTPYDMAKHDPIEYQNAYQDLNTVVMLYPNSPYVQDARRRMMYLSNTMAQYQLNVATYYFQMKAYVAAVTRAKGVLIHYPQTPALEGALSIMAQSYEQLNLPELEKSALLLLKANFPNDPLVKNMPMPTLVQANQAKAQQTNALVVPPPLAPSKTPVTKKQPISVKIKPLKQPSNTSPMPPPTTSANPK
jgi:outer membrane protein assembly factor BamD